ncbi:MAG: hypothetical protein CJBNEKGG_02505 [Prosthecobacter sp.]|nr:hypothetical protein [Prosthecobacter sp.]
MLFSQKFDVPPDGQPSRLHTILRPVIALWHWLVPPTQAHRDRQSRTARITAISVLILGCLGLILLGFSYARPLYDIYQNWQAERLYREALAETNDQNYQQAWWKVQRAVQIAPNNINAIRLAAEYLTGLKRPEALHFLDQLDKQGATTDQDRMVRIRALMNLNRPKDASILLEEMLSKQGADEKLMYLAESVWSKSQRNEILIKTMKAYADKNPANLEHSLRLAGVQISSERAVDVSEGLRRAWQVAEKDDDLGLAALMLIDNVSDLAPDEARRLIARFRSHPKATGVHLVKALRRQIKLEPLHREQLIAEAMETARQRKREDKAALVRWLLEPPQNEYHKVLALVGEDEALTYQPLLENYLNALTMLRRFDDVERLLDDERTSKILSQTVLTFFRAHLAYITTKSTEETRAALITAKNASDREHRADLLVQIARYAEERGHADIAEEAFRSVSRIGDHERAGFDGLIRTTRSNGNSEGLLAASSEAIRRWPDDNKYMEEYLYACLLTGHDIELSLLRAQKLHEAQPQDQQRRLFLAMSAWRIKDMAGTLKLLGQINPEDPGLTPGQRAVIAAIARETPANNAAEAARSVLRNIDPKARMMPEEKMCFIRAAQ